MQPYKGQLIGNGGKAEWVVTLSPIGGWLIYEVAPHLPDGSYALTFGDGYEKKPAGAHKLGWACFEHRVWKVQDVKDA